MNCAQMINRVRRRTGNTSKSKTPDSVVIEFLNDALEKVNEWSDGRGIEKTGTFAITANKDWYTVPADFMAVNKVISPDNIELESRSWDKLLQYVKQGLHNTSWYHAIWGDKLMIVGKRGSASPSSTLNAAVTISETDSIEVVYDADNGFPTVGTVKINDEKIRYHHSSINGSVVTLSFLERAQEHTAAAEHSSGASVQLCDLEMLYWAKSLDFLYPPDAIGRITAGTGTAVDTGDHYYKFSYYDPSTGRESIPREFGKITVAADSQNITLSQLEDDPEAAGWKKRIYRTKAGTSSPFYLVATLDSGTTSYEDTTADADLSAVEWDDDNMVCDYDEVYHNPIVKMAIALAKMDDLLYEEAELWESKAYNEFIDRFHQRKRTLEDDMDIPGSF